MTWNKWHERCLNEMEAELTEGTVVGYKNGFTKWLPLSWRNKALTSFTREDVSNLIYHEMTKNPNVSKNIQRTVLQKIKRVFQLAVDSDLLPKNPASTISVKVPVKTQEVLNSNDVNLLLHAAKECNHPYYYHWAIVLFTAMRSGELYALRWADVDFQTKLIHITKQWTAKDGLHPTKSNSNRVVPICPQLKKILLEVKNNGPYEERFLLGKKTLKKYPLGDSRRLGPKFTDLVLPRSSDWRHGEQAKFLKSFCQSVGITPVKFHDLRATVITNMLAKGVPLAKVMAIAGHTDISVTNEYLRLAGVDIQEGTTHKLSYYAPERIRNNLVNLYK